MGFRINEWTSNMKKSIFVTIILFCLTAFAATRALQGDSWKSNDLSKTWNPPSVSDTLVGTSATQTLTNKTFTGGTVSATTLSGLITNTGTVSGGTIVDPTMAAIISIGGGKLTIPFSSADTFTTNGGSQTLTNKTIQSPIVTGNVSGTPTFTNLVTFTGGVSSTSASSFTNLTVNTNALNLAVGQIKFPATASISSDATTLDDYEEGSCTLGVRGTSTSGTANYTVNVCRYSKIGDSVNLNAYLSWNTGTGTGNLLMTGLPFTSRTTTNYRSGCAIGLLDSVVLSATNTPMLVITNNTTEGAWNQMPSGGGSTTAIAYDAAGLFMINCNYQTEQ